MLNRKDWVVEAVAKAIWENQRSKTIINAFAHNRVWRDNSAPIVFWEAYIDDAIAAIEASRLLDLDDNFHW